MIETDFPHNSTWYPYSMEKAQEWTVGLPDDVKWKILRGNAERVFDFTPAEPPVLANACKFVGPRARPTPSHRVDGQASSAPIHRARRFHNTWRVPALLWQCADLSRMNRVMSRDDV